MGWSSDTSDYIVRMDPLDPEVCWRLIARTRFGRVSFIAGGELAVRPVNCGVLDQQVVFRTGADTTLGAMADRTPVVFEADQTDDVAESGRSVLVKGLLVRVTDARELALLAEFELHPWAPGVKDRWMKIIPAEVTGRAVSRHHGRSAASHVSYMPPD